MSENYSLNALELTLRKLKWTSKQSMNPQMELWIPGDESILTPLSAMDDTGVFVPNDTEAPDFEKQLHRAVRQLVEFSAVSVFEELELAELRISNSLDEMQLHVDGPEIKEGIVGWQQGVDLVNGAKQLLIAGAKTTQDYRRHFANAESTIAKNFINNCYMGQTQVGSYIVSALIPSLKEIETSTSKKKKANTAVKGRDITETMFSALEASHDVLEDFKIYKDEEVFEWGMTQGVSAEILRGIRDIIGQGETEISVDYYPSDSDDKFPISRKVEFSPDHKTAAVMGDKILSKAPKPQNIQISGEVISLARRFDDPESARIKVRGVYNRKLRVFTARLSSEDYQKALDAHDYQFMLMLTGKADGGVFIEVEKVILTNAKVGASIQTADPDQDNQLRLIEDVASGN